MQPMGQPMAAMQPMGMPKLIGVLVPVTLATPMGEVTVQLHFGEAEAQNVPQLLSQLMQAGYPIKAYAPKQQFGGGGGQFNGGGGGYGGYRPRRW